MKLRTISLIAAASIGILSTPAFAAQQSTYPTLWLQNDGDTPINIVQGGASTCISTGAPAVLTPHNVLAGNKIEQLANSCKYTFITPRKNNPVTVVTVKYAFNFLDNSILFRDIQVSGNSVVVTSHQYDTISIKGVN